MKQNSTFSVCSGKFEIPIFETRQGYNFFSAPGLFIFLTPTAFGRGSWGLVTIRAMFNVQVSKWFDFCQVLNGLCIVNVSLQLMRETNNQKRALDRMPSDNRGKCHSSCQIWICRRSLKKILIIPVCTVYLLHIQYSVLLQKGVSHM